MGWRICMAVVSCVVSCHRSAANEPMTLTVVCSVNEERAGASITEHGVSRSDFHWLSSDYPGSVGLRALVAEPRYGERTQSSVIVGCTPNIANVRHIAMTRGRFLTPRDNTQAENVCVISAAVAKRLFGNAEPVGKNLRLLDDFYLIVGVCADSSEAICGTHLRSVYKQDKYDTLMYVPLKAMQARMGDTHVYRANGAFSGHRFGLSEVWTDGDKAGVESILRRTRARDASLSDLLVTRRAFDSMSE